MKNKTIAFFLALFALVGTAQAASPLLRLSQSGGMPTPGGSQGKDLTLMSDGVVLLTNYEAHETKTQAILMISNKAYLERIAKIVNNLSTGPLVSEDPHGSPCMDTPSIGYSVFQGGKEILIKGIYNCQAEVLKDEVARSQAEQLASELDTLTRFSY